MASTRHQSPPAAGPTAPAAGERPAETASARRTAIWNARLALAMSVIGNAVYHGLHLGSWTTTDVILTVISAWPPLIVERILHLCGSISGASRWVYSVLYVGSAAALAAAAGISFQTLEGLGALIGLRQPWLLPIAIDVYASTATILSLLLPAGPTATPAAAIPSAPPKAAVEPAAPGPAPDRRPAVVPAPSAALTADTRPALDPAPEPAIGTGGAGSRPAPSAATNRRPPTAAAGVTDIATAGGGMNLDQWAAVATPVYRRLTADAGRTPAAPALAAELARLGHPAVKDNRAKAIRRAVEERLAAEPTPDQGDQADPEREQEAG